MKSKIRKGIKTKSKVISSSLSLVLVLFGGGIVNNQTQIVHASDTSILDDTSNRACFVLDGDETGTGSSGSDKSDSKVVAGDIPNPQNLKLFYDYANGKYGLSAAAVAGIWGNFGKESRGDPTAVEPSLFGVAVAKAQKKGAGTGIGLGQWSFDRRDALISWGEKNYNGEWWTVNAELDFMFNGDGMFVDRLKQYAEQATDDPVKNAVLFHKIWEISADSEATVASDRGGGATKAYDYMKSNGMSGGKDDQKIAKISPSGSDGQKPTATTGSVGEEDSNCDKSYSGDASGKIGKSVDANGKHGQSIGGGWLRNQIPQKYASAITIPDFKAPDWSSSPFNSGGLAGQCTELTYQYMGQLWEGKRPTTGNGGDVYQGYKAGGATMTSKPTVGYGFSTRGGMGSGAAYGHTGVVVAVYSDGSFLTANFNVPPYAAPSRKVVYILVDGNDGHTFQFFSGTGKPKIDENK